MIHMFTSCEVIKSMWKSTVIFFCMVIYFHEKLDFPMRENGQDGILSIWIVKSLWIMFTVRERLLLMDEDVYFFQAGLFTRSHSFIMNSICTCNWEIQSIFKHLTISKSITSVYMWAWTGGFSVLQISTKNVKSFTCSNFFFSFFLRC